MKNFIVFLILTTATHIFACVNEQRFKVDVDKIHDQWHGTYYHNSYETASNGVGYGAEYTINIGKNICSIDIVGFQADKHFSCNIEKVSDNVLNIYDEYNENFSTLRKISNTYHLKIYGGNE